MRLALQVLADTFAYWWGQLVMGLVTGIAGPLIALHLGWIPQGEVWKAIGIVVISLTGPALVSLLVNAFRAPVKLDNGREREISGLEKRKRSVEAELDSMRVAKPKREPLDERRYQQTKEIVGTLSTQAKMVLLHILDHEKVRKGVYQIPGLESADVHSMLEVGELAAETARVIVRKEWDRKPHLVTWWEIVPGYQSALREVLNESELPK